MQMVLSAVLSENVDSLIKLGFSPPQNFTQRSPNKELMSMSKVTTAINETVLQLLLN